MTGAAAIARAVAAGDITARAVTEAALARIDRAEPGLGAFTDITTLRALNEADTIDRAHAAGAPLGPLAGVPYAVKNLFDIAGLVTRAGSKINRSNPPATADAALVNRMQTAGAILLGGLNMGEYAYDFTGENAHDGPSRNPHDSARMSGGSSGGSGSAVAAGLVPLALGSDTNGSIRVPSALCGIFGLKPTYGRLPRTGSFPFCDSLDHLGPFARSTEDLALVYDCLQGPERLDPACARRPVEPTLPELTRGSEGLRFAIAGSYFRKFAQPAALAAVDNAARALGIDNIVDLPQAARARAAAFLITNAESSSLHLDRLRGSADAFDPDTRDRFLAGALLPATWVIRAQRFRHWYHDQVMDLFRHVDVILAPATPCPAPLLGQKTLVIDGETMPLRPSLGLFTQPISLIGLPVAVVPVFAAGTLPLGVQIIAAPWREDLCLRTAAALEAAGIAKAHEPPAETPWT
jgi:aspartyl-tRNA(Asn)/glutamyl-tRNA(Gln) amidotransferase subunit A